MHFESSTFVVMYWKRAPFLRIVIPLLTGIIWQLNYPLPPVLLLVVLGIAFTGILVFRFLPLSWRFAAVWAPGILLFILVGTCGQLLLYHADLRHRSGFYRQQLTDTPLYLLRINEPPEEKARSYKTTARVLAVYQSTHWIPVKGYLMLYLAKDSLGPALSYGEELLVRKTPEIIRFNGNPGAFNYQRYLVTQQIYEQLYLRKTDFYLLPHRGGAAGQHLLLRARDYCLNNLKKYIGEGREAGMAEALLIGYRQDLDKEVVQDYSNTGIVHVIAISGMHLALLYGVLLWLLKWMPPWRWADKGKAVVILFVLWAFALLTGASASVLRSAVMFSGITIGRFVLSRYSSIYNTLAASATLLLCFNPYLAIDAGFQLSYLAVLSILLFYQPLYKLRERKSKWADLLWQMVTLSLAAQLITTPVSLFYFHQFPNYFLPANLIAVPLSTVIIYGEVILLLVAPLGLPAVWLGRGLKYLICWMNTAVAWLGDLPGAMIRDIHCSLLQTILLYLLIAGLAAWLLVKYRPGLWLALCCSWGVLLAHVNWVVNCRAQRKMIIYNVPGYTAVDCIAGRRVRFTGSDTIWQLPVAAQLMNARRQLGAREGIPASFRQYGHCLSFEGKRLLVIDSALPERAPPEKFHTNYILLTRNPPVDISRLGDFYTFDTLIFAASNSSRRIEQWKSDCYVLTLRFFSVPDQGAYVINF
ncbi:ComEC/Rec2 family competence protein [Chitinophaga arvensicola]|uniref:Competence protein ComEC n=1 Tax=Chitinophaga arvensicola TaxID=29529 RepID=A0A1I0NYH2_9BACT|nr:ComEC/Rec2 family competence protein [Chitinophaga arvensicola]SEW06853.1 competence protein ComEC [Chitinophaga arvensicola]